MSLVATPVTFLHEPVHCDEEVVLSDHRVSRMSRGNSEEPPTQRTRSPDRRDGGRILSREEMRGHAVIFRNVMDIGRRQGMYLPRNDPV